MHLLAPLAALLGIEVETITGRLRKTIIINVVMVALAVIGVSFLVVAGFLALAQLYGAIYAALILAGVFLLLTLAVFLSTRLGEGGRRREAAERRRSTETSAFVTTAALTALPALMKSPMGRAIGIPAAALAAYLLLARKGGAPRDD